MATTKLQMQKAFQDQLKRIREKNISEKRKKEMEKRMREQARKAAEQASKAAGQARKTAGQRSNRNTLQIKY